MANIHGMTGTKFIGNPMTVPVESEIVAGNPTFHRVCLKVTVSNATSVVGEYEFTLPCGNRETVQFDVSSALRSAADSYRYTATGYSYPKYTFALTAWDEYLIDGIAYKVGEETSTFGGWLYLGALSDRERLTVHRPDRYSHKPATAASPDVVFAGATVLYPGVYNEEPAVTEYTPTAAQTGKYIDDYKAYVIARPADGYVMRFVNALGVHETVHVRCLRTVEVAVTTERYVIARTETVSSFSHGLAVKKNDHERWKMSTPPLDKAWQQWYLHEVLAARQAWIEVDGLWLQVHILPEETVKGIDRQKATPLAVEFTIEFDIEGSPFNY